MKELSEEMKAKAKSMCGTPSRWGISLESLYAAVSACLEGMVSLDDVEKAIRETFDSSSWAMGEARNFIEGVRAHLQQGEASAAHFSIDKTDEYDMRAEAPAPAEQDTGLVEGAMDFPQAWEFTRSTKESDHSPKCSWIQARLLCDCAVLWAEDYKRRLSVARARIREQAGREVRAERVRSRMMGIEDAIHAFSDESLVTENKALHTAIENFWKCQASGHQCGCDEWPECKHTLDAHDLRKIAMGVDRPGCRTAQPAKEGTR